MGKKLFVGNLPDSATDKTLLDAFTQCGTVESAKVINHRDTGRSKGFGFVEMSSNGEAQKAIRQLNDSMLADRQIKVSAQPTGYVWL